MSFFSRPTVHTDGSPAAETANGATPDVRAVLARRPDSLQERKLSSYTELKVSLHQQLLDMINLSVIDKMPANEFRTQMGEMIRELLVRENRPLNRQEQSQLVDDILDELLGLGPIEPLLKDASVTDILVNCHSNVFVERGGQLHPTAVRFKDDRHLLRIIDRIVSAVGRRVDESQPMVDARLADGSRVNAIIPPLAVDGPLLSIRKFAKVPIDMDKLVAIGSLPQSVADLLKGIVKSRRNVLISGGTGSGKTTMLRCWRVWFPAGRRVPAAIAARQRPRSL